MTKRVRIKAPATELLDKPAPARAPLFRFADVGRGPATLGSHQTIHGAD